MRRSGKPLDVKTLKALKPRAMTYRVSDGDGLLLEVRPAEQGVARRLTVDGKRRDMGSGWLSSGDASYRPRRRTGCQTSSQGWG